jgi:hypothetical protein
MSHHEHWDGPDAFETSGEPAGRRSKGGCIGVLLLMTIASLALAYPTFGIALIIIGLAIFVAKSLRQG